MVNLLRRYSPSPVTLFEEDALMNPSACRIAITHSPSERRLTFFEDRVQLQFSSAFVGHIYEIEIELSNIHDATHVTFQFKHSGNKAVSFEARLTENNLNYSKDVFFCR